MSVQDLRAQLSPDESTKGVKTARTKGGVVSGYLRTDMPAKGLLARYFPGARRHTNDSDNESLDRNSFIMNGGIHHAPGGPRSSGGVGGSRGPPIGHKDSNATNITTTSSIDDPETPTDTAQVRLAGGGRVGVGGTEGGGRGEKGEREAGGGERGR